MSYVRLKHNSMLVLHPSYPGVNQDKFKSEENWKALYATLRRPCLPMLLSLLVGRSLFVCLLIWITRATSRTADLKLGS